MNGKKSFLTNKSHNFSTVLIMNRTNLLFSILCKLMAVSIMFGLVIFPMHDEMDNLGMEKDIIIRSHTENFAEHKVKKYAASCYAVLENILKIFNFKSEISKPLAIIPFFDFFHSFSSRILRL